MSHFCPFSSIPIGHLYRALEALVSGFRGAQSKASTPCAVSLHLPPSKQTVIETAFVLEATRHEYRVIRMWEEDPERFLYDEALLPLAPLAATTSEQLLRQVVQQVSRIESTEQRREVSAYAQILAGLKFKRTLIRQVFREGIMRESVIYQEIHQEGRQEGKQEDRQEEGLLLVLRLLIRRVGELSPELKSQVEILPLLLLEDLGEALLDFSQPEDLVAWLQGHQES